MGRKTGTPGSKHDEASGPVFRSTTGATDHGGPLSLNRQADERIRPWVSRAMVAYAYERQNKTIYGELCNDSAYLRSAVGTDWRAGTADGPIKLRDQTFLCGQHSHVMPLSCTGGIRVAGLKLKPGALRALFGIDDAAMLDRIWSIEAGGVPDREVTGLFNLELEPEQWLEALEGWLADYVTRKGIEPPEKLSQAIELQAFADPNCVLSDFADEQGVSPRTVERVAKRDFGLTPKQIMRRARVLDLAAQLCGVADEAEADDIILRFFDQAHQIREFQAFFKVTPGEFQTTRSDLLTLSLEVRQARRLELLDRIRPGAVRPWMRRSLMEPAE